MPLCLIDRLFQPAQSNQLVEVSEQIEQNTKCQVFINFLDKSKSNSGKPLVESQASSSALLTSIVQMKLPFRFRSQTRRPRTQLHTVYNNFAKLKSHQLNFCLYETLNQVILLNYQSNAISSTTYHQ